MKGRGQKALVVPSPEQSDRSVILLRLGHGEPVQQQCFYHTAMLLPTHTHFSSESARVPEHLKTVGRKPPFLSTHLPYCTLSKEIQ